MNRKIQIGNTCRERVAKAMRFSCWRELTRFQTTHKKQKLNNVADTLIIEETTLQFAGWWSIIKEKENITLPFPEKQHLERFLYEEIH